jgi:hypothetical protein
MKCIKNFDRKSLGRPKWISQCDIKRDITVLCPTAGFAPNAVEHSTCTARPVVYYDVPATSRLPAGAV